jgi:hypothetical protein
MVVIMYLEYSVNRERERFYEGILAARLSGIERMAKMIGCGEQGISEGNEYINEHKENNDA